METLKLLFIVIMAILVVYRIYIDTQKSDRDAQKKGEEITKIATRIITLEREDAIDGLTPSEAQELGECRVKLKKLFR